MTYTTLSLIQAEIGCDAITASTTPSSSQVETWISEVEDIIDITAGTIFSTSLVSSEYVDYDGSGVILMPEHPITSVDEIRYNRQDITSSTPNWVTLQEGYGKNYITYNDFGEVEFINGNGATNIVTPQAGKKKLCLSYHWGHTTVPLEIQRLATLMVSKQIINQLINQQANTLGGEVSVGPITVKDPSNFSIGQIKCINQEIDSLMSQIGQKFKTYRYTKRNWD